MLRFEALGCSYELLQIILLKGESNIYLLSKYSNKIAKHETFWVANLHEVIYTDNFISYFKNIHISLLF